MKLKNSVKKYRQIKGLTQEELGLKSGVSRQTIISIERYRYKPSLELGLKMAFALDMNINELFFLDLKQTKANKPSITNNSENEPKKFQDFKEKDWKNLWVNLKNKD